MAFCAVPVSLSHTMHPLVLYVTLRIWTFLKLWTLRLCLMLQEGEVAVPKERKERERTHSILGMGDDHIMGFGDYATLFSPIGVPGRLQKLISSDVSLRQSWAVLNKGKQGSSTKDWMPRVGRRKGGKLWEACVEKKSFQQCCRCVILSLGSSDHAAGIGASETKENLKAICEALLERNVLVFIATLPAFGILGEQLETVELINAFIRSYVERRKHSKLRLGLELDSLKFSSPLYRGFLGKYFNPKGHKVMADAWLLHMGNDLRAVEWKVWKKQLA